MIYFLYGILLKSRGFIRSAHCQACSCIYSEKKIPKRIAAYEKAVYSKKLVYGLNRFGVIFFYCLLFTLNLLTVAKLLTWCRETKTTTSVWKMTGLGRIFFRILCKNRADVRIFHFPTFWHPIKVAKHGDGKDSKGNPCLKTERQGILTYVVGQHSLLRGDGSLPISTTGLTCLN